MIATCDICERPDVPGSNCTVQGIETFACYLCHGDVDPDPYCEIEVECRACGGEGRDIRYGITYEQGCAHPHMGEVDHGICPVCLGERCQWLQCSPVTIEDLDAEADEGFPS